MAATNYTPIQLYHSTTASAVPLAANLAQGELAINITDGKLYYEDSGGVVQVIATKGAGTIGGSTTQIQYNNAGALAGNAAMTFNSGTNVTTLTTLNLTNALGAIYGGTAQSAYTQGDVLYASATNTLAKLGIGVVNYILTSTGSVPQWVAPTSITVNTATNLAGGLAGSVPYQSAVDATTFLAIGAANRVMTSSGSAPQWVTSLTGLTGVSSSSITNTSLTSGRVVISSTAGLEADSANLTFNGTTLSTTGLSNTGFSTLVKTLTLGDSSFNGAAVFAPATPAKLYLGTGTVTDVTSAASATNTTGAIASLAITPIAATNTSVTYTNASTLYIAGAPSAGTNITITNPYSLYIAAGASYFGGAVDFAVTPSYSGGTANGVMYLNGSKQITTGAVLTFDGTILSSTRFAGALNGTVGATTPTTGAFTTLSSTGGGVKTLLGNQIYPETALNSFVGVFSDSSAAIGILLYGNSHATKPSQVELNAPNGLTVTGALTTPSTVTLSGGTANGVAYLNGSKVLTTGAALTFNGTNTLSIDGGTTGYIAGPSGEMLIGEDSTALYIGEGLGTTPAIPIFYGSSGTTFQRWKAGGSEQMRLTSTGLGIGTSSPSNPLHINAAAGASIARWSDSTNGVLGFIGSASGLISGAPANQLAIRAENGLRLSGQGNNTSAIIDASGNLGIGTSSPQTRLVVSNGSNENIEFFSGSVTLNGGGFEYINRTTATTRPDFNYYLGINGAHKFYISGSEQMRLTSTGLGIGTSSPSYKLDVVGQIKQQQNAPAAYTTQILENTATNGFAQFQFYVGSNGANGLASISYAPGIFFAIGPVNNDTTTPIVFRNNNGTERMRLDSSGNLGIGTSSPAAKLQVVASSADYVTPQLMLGESSVATGKQLHVGYNTTANTGYIQAVHNGTGYKDLIINPNGGNLGLGVTPSAWYAASSAYKAMQLGVTGAIWGRDANETTGVSSNAYASGSGTFNYIASGNFASAYIQDSSTHRWLIAPSGTAGNAITFTQAMTLDASGNLGVGTSSPTSRGHFVAADNGSDDNTITLGFAFNSTSVQLGSIGTHNINSTDGGLKFSTLASGTLAERMRLDSTGNLLVGTTSNTNSSKVFALASAASPAFASQGVTGDVSVPAALFGKFDNDSTTNQVLVRFTTNNNSAGSGQINANGANSAAFGSFSDSRLKENIVDLPPQLSNIMGLRPVEFDYIETEGGGHQTGFIAQEMQGVYPDAVGEREDGMKTVTGWSKTEARLVKAIQEQQALIESLIARVAQLESKP